MESISTTPSFRVAVIIVNYNGGDYLVRCLNALRNQTVPVWRTIVVDNASNIRPLSGTEEWLGETGVIRLEKNIGFAAANNLGVRNAEDADWIALLNPDAFPEPGWLEALLVAASSFPDFSCFASRMLDANDPAVLDGAGDDYFTSGRPFRRGHGEPAADRYERQEEVFSPCAAAALYRKSAFDAVGGFDEDFFCYSEDVDLGFRLRLAGHRCLYVPGAVVLHIGSAITGRRSAFSVYHGHRNLVWAYWKNMPGILFWLYLPQHLLMNLAGVISLALKGEARAVLAAKRDAVKGLPGILKKRRRLQGERRAATAEIRRHLKRGLL